MTRDEEVAEKIIREVIGDDPDFCPATNRAIIEALSKAREEERERCAKVAENLVVTFLDESNNARSYGPIETRKKIAAAIREGK